MLKQLPVLNALWLALVWLVFVPCPAHAYFDLGTGTYMVQLIFGFGAAFLLSLKHKWFKKGKSNAEPMVSNDSPNSGTEDEHKPDPAGTP